MTLADGLELCMSQWGIPADHILGHWSEAFLLLMMESMGKRIKAQADAMAGGRQGKTTRHVSGDQFIAEVFGGRGGIR